MNFKVRNQIQDWFRNTISDYSKIRRRKEEKVNKERKKAVFDFNSKLPYMFFKFEKFQEEENLFDELHIIFIS